jgi:hypothetical protein
MKKTDMDVNVEMRSGTRERWISPSALEQASVHFKGL